MLNICTKINCKAVDWQYDLSVTTFSPDGRVFQIEYATKAVDNSGYKCLFIISISIIIYN